MFNLLESKFYVKTRYYEQQRTAQNSEGLSSEIFFTEVLIKNAKKTQANRLLHAAVGTFEG